MRDRLGTLPLFADLDDAQLDRLAAATSEFDAPAGQALIERGRPGSGIFVLEEGHAIVEAPEGTRQIGPGDVFGERALFGEDISRTARVRAETDVRCLAIARPELEQLLAEDPRVADRLRQLSA
ncbi:MAG: voltage-gated potassium channel [Gaiellaceae bacterium]|jgi:NTE family protein|nr:voltage-gated potassium channel [Gaiellaceae bacterium]MDX6435653.1 voltage-gated potassium channel [Gaiellaceae bacterium]